MMELKTLGLWKVYFKFTVERHNQKMWLGYCLHLFLFDLLSQNYNVNLLSKCSFRMHGGPSGDSIKLLIRLFLFNGIASLVS